MSASLIRRLGQAEQRLRAGDSPGARSLCEQILRSAPANPDALCLLGVAHLADGRAREAVPALRQALAADPRHGAALEHLGLAHLMLGEFGEAESVLARAAALRGAPASAIMRHGVALLEQGRAGESLPVLRRALAAAPGEPDCHLNLGRALAQSGDVGGAQEHFHAVLRLAPDHAAAAFNLGALALLRDDLAQARGWFERVLERSPRYADAMVSLAIVLQRESRLDEAAALLRRALALDPASPAAGSELGRTLALQGRLEEARESYLGALRAAPRFTAAHEGLASVCLALGRVGEGIEHLKATLEAEPDNGAAGLALAGALFEAGQLEEAEARARRVLQADPGAGAAYVTLANLHLVRGALDSAIATLEDGYAATRDTALLGMLAYQLRQACDWTRWEQVWAEVAPALERGAALGSPFWLLCEPTTAAQQLDYTRRWAQARFGPAAAGAQPPARPARRPRLRVGYLSSDFQEHAVGFLISRVLELHDRSRFEVYAYSHGPREDTPLRRRLRAACEHFTDIAREPDDEAARRIRGDDLDLLVDLKGYTVGDRLAVMARRPCRVQVAWLGYPGTTGASFMDYLVVDPFLVPEGAEAAYSERIVRLPHCYQPSSREREVDATLERAEYGLPERAFVFCCFNQAGKITPEVFAAWMRLLAGAPGSILWLLECNPLAKRNLIERAQAHGVAPERLVFAPWQPNAAHLARYRAADLALDTFPYTSHTTLSDALWCGCPAVAWRGGTFAARVSGSILSTAGLPDLVTGSLSEYEALAARLAGDPALLSEIRLRVARAKDASPLYDMEAFTRALEALYVSLASPPGE